MRKTSLAGILVLYACFCLLGGNKLTLSLDIENKASSPAKRIKSWEQHQRLKQQSPFKDLKWRAVGPEFQGGRIEAIVR